MTEDNNDIIDLLTNEDFRKWVLEPSYERALFWEKWMKNNPDRIEAVNAAKEFIRSTRYRNLNVSAAEKDQILSEIIAETTMVTPMMRSSRPKKSSKVWYRAAAAVLLLGTALSIYWWSNVNEPLPVQKSNLVEVVKENPQGRKSTVFLPDGTRVSLNAESKITYSTDYGKETRTVTLTGEAYFEVKHNPSKPFKVISENIMTVALGTAFNVRDFKDEKDLRVALKNGKVLVKNMSNHTKDFLEPGEGFVIPKSSGELELVKINPLEEFGWKDGILMFKNSSLDDVKERLERWYGVTIKINGKPKVPWRVDAKFKNESLEEVLNGLDFTYDLTYKIDGKNVELNLN
ncbi:FecR family protein [Fulvivirga ligni]|uniref:FecR family protein n=1 Tax=Fulvivirga ligni TaxID=2904246 RepID=UPI001F4796E6|nr:FecR family protein [Fulvivirga ligni]UII19993.1 DUF4974 domain-containing protein [Fulvivirga ligni]